MEDVSKYSHSPAHLAVARRDYVGLRRIVSNLPRLAKAGEVTTEDQSVAAELEADAFSAIIDRRDVPGRETPLHLAVKLKDQTSAEILMAAGADWSLQNENGWSALQEAVCTREEAIALVIARYYQPLAWAKWCRRLPRIVGSAARIRDFYMEITFHFDSSVIPFIGRIAPSDTYRIWKRGANLRADMTLAGFDGFRIQRSDQTFMFLGEGYSSEDGSTSLQPGSLIVLAHKEKEVTNALEGAGAQPTEAEVANEVAMMSQTNMYRPGIDVTQAELVPHLNWRRQERSEMVGSWKAKVHDMLNVMVSVKSRRVPGAMTDEELFAEEDEERLANGADQDDFDDVLTPEERKQLDSALRMGNSDGVGEDEEAGFLEYQENGSGGPCENGESRGTTKEKKGWFGWKNKSAKHHSDDSEGPKTSKKVLVLQVAIPIVPTIRVIVTFTKFEELMPVVEEFSTPPSSPTHFQDAKSKDFDGAPTTSWMSWMKGSRGGQSSDSDGPWHKDETDPFHIPSDYKWVDAKEKIRRIKARKAKTKKHRKPQQSGRSGGGGGGGDSVGHRHAEE
ncbi:Ankyrin repeat domain-containing protein 13B [Linum perenne]